MPNDLFWSRAGIALIIFSILLGFAIIDLVNVRMRKKHTEENEGLFLNDNNPPPPPPQLDDDWTYKDIWMDKFKTTDAALADKLIMFDHEKNGWFYHSIDGGKPEFTPKYSIAINKEVTYLRTIAEHGKNTLV